MRFSAKMPGENKVIEGLVRPNSLFLSAAAQNNHERLLPVYRWFAEALMFREKADRTVSQRLTAILLKDPESKRVIVNLLRNADVGITDVNVKEPDAKTLALFVESLGASGERDNFEIQHLSGETVARLPLSQESEGTVVYLSLLGWIILALKSGGVLCIDELDASLHPLLALRLVEIFNNQAANPNSAQLIFNTHDTNLLGGGHLRRDQIWFTEKDGSGSSQLYPLTDFKPRAGENLQNGYLQGRYGAIPFLNASAFLSALEIHATR
jgi:AAA15 family ATPase/GTPase